MGGTCYGGDSSLLFEKAKSWAVPVETCRNYLAINPSKFFCDRKEICETNTPAGPKKFDDFPSLKVEDWGRLKGPDMMKQHLLEGPIVCDIMVTPEFVKYGYYKD